MERVHTARLLHFARLVLAIALAVPILATSAAAISQDNVVNAVDNSTEGLACSPIPVPRPLDFITCPQENLVRAYKNDDSVLPEPGILVDIEV